MPFHSRWTTVGLVFVSTQLAYASTNKVGNGGNVIVCKNGSQPTAQLLDFYEYGIPKKSTPESAEKLANLMIDRLALAAPKLAALYRKRLQELPSQLEFKNDVILTNTEDSLHLFRPVDPNCEVVQTVIRRNQAVSGQLPFLLRKDVWNQLDTQGQAGLLMHEIIYEHLFKLGEENSVKARRLNALIFSPEFTQERFWSVIKELRLPIYP
jgi:hypothetical protein